MPTDAPAGDVEPAADLILSAEVARSGTRTVAAATVRIGKRVVTETRTITVQVRREELYIKHTEAPEPTVDDTDDADSPAYGARGDGPVLLLVLHEEVPEVVTRVVPIESVSVFIDRLDGVETASIDLRHEEVDLTEEHSRR